MNLRRDPDVASLQGRPDYEVLVGRNMAALEQLKVDIKPYRIDLLPEEPTGQAMPLLVTLHANGSNAEANRHHWNVPTAHGWMVTMPQSTQPGGRNTFVWDDVDQAVADVLGHVQEVSAHHRVDAERVVLGGFSKGGQIAPLLALTGKIPARGFVVLGPYVPLAVLESWTPMIQSAAQKGLRGYVVIGEEDRPCLPLALALHQAMVDSGAACKLRRYPGLEHEYPADWETVLMDALTFITG
jgi:predicted esterase